jgi:tRNA threonylcarbamoyladenosine biosynthesis protein TsaB
MVTLALDTSTSLGGVAILKEDTVLGCVTWEREGSHGEHLTPALEKCLEAAGVETKDLDAIALGHGPGSFTGVRIAVNAARSLAFVLKKPVYCFDTTEILAFGCARRDLPFLALVNAHKNLLYSSVFAHDPASGNWQRTTPLEARSIAEIEALVTSPHLCAGDGFDEYEKVFGPELRSFLVRDASTSDYPRPETLGRLFWSSRQSAQPLVWKEVQALYIRASGAEEKLRESRKDSSGN